MSKENNINKNWKKDFPIQKEEAIQVSRRDFAKFLTLVSGGLMIGSGLVAAKAYLFPKEEVEGEQYVCNKGDIPIGGTKAFQIKGSNIPYILIHLEDGTFRAYEQKCTHLSCAVYYKPGSGQIICPCHEGHFDAKTGEVLAGPPPRPLPQLAVIEKQENLYVKAITSQIT
ncbi:MULTISPECIES: ubiquinol-cytochrome c reductase iron-sulfur subunit [Flavobacterium]|uniref:Cytochrome b6-f complex iron-sulfur subunit n=2 Tax=Flavobacterium TaxID=237 RepID=A0A2N9PCL7_9FLAO|nr:MULTISPECIES: Rieske (2Fe-2S) protein [Flavobacterium]QYS88974.1 Rieske (2Fe-2S) protein [Flavobacterium davisii]RVU90189.1 Rieske (2Fe-2S) protein [Flavobacterium columnare]SPE78090.1 Cytochrome b6-f complex iron-sulfur subunit [Flavobacterium columnare]